MCENIATNAALLATSDGALWVNERDSNLSFGRQFLPGYVFWKGPSGQYGSFPAWKEATDRLTEFGAAISASLLSAADAASFLSASALEV